ncbi:MAG: DUF4097 family beta strand repeat-containing protein [Pyrinomonadaceae bacterium]
MRVKLLAGLLLVALASVAHAGSIFDGFDGRAAARDDDADFTERDSSRQTYQLSPGASLEIFSVSGNVTVETSATDQAEVEIVRTARTREDLECRKFKVEASANRLRLEGSDDRRQCRNVQVNQSVTMRVPRRVNLDVKSVSGNVRVGELDGTAHLQSISGSATVARATGEAFITSVSGRVSVNLSQLGGGVRINSVSGSVEVGLPDGANADVSVHSVSGSVTADMPGLTIRKIGEGSDYEGRLGAGGTQMSVSSVSGSVRFHRAGE